jgi:biotin-(acetyl-CoA carboxylase) ligase
MLNSFEPLWTELDEAGPAGIVSAWTAAATFWGQPLSVRTPAGEVNGIARALDGDGALLLETASGRPVRVVAGDIGAP